MSRTWSILVCVAVLPAASAWAQARPARNEAVRRLTEAAGTPVSVAISPETGGITFLSLTPGQGIPVLASPTAGADSRALSFLATHGDGFFIRDKSQLEVQRVGPVDAAGLEHVRLRQLHRGLPVTGAELVVHLRGDRVTAVSGQTLDDLESIDVQPAVQPADAQETVRQALGGKTQSIDVVLGEPRLEVFNRGLLEKRRYPTRLAWFVVGTALDRREFTWVDAQTGHLLLRFSQLPDARSRAVHLASVPDTLPQALARSEGGPATGNLDVDAAYDFSGSAYDYFFTTHGRDSFDGAGGVIRTTVNFCQTGSSCPYVNAFWNGTQLVFGAQMSRADDVVAHELSHGVVEFTANLYYYMQSGALNESFADIFGETTDQLNGLGTDTPAQKWVVGEDVYVGPARNMMNPPALGSPGKMSDNAFFDCGTPGDDGGGVHTNSGVLNHAYALMVDGGSFNGRTVTAIGLLKAGKIAYRALDQYLVSSSGFLDAYQAFRQSCHDLIGVSGITSFDCWQVQTAMDAVELSDPWPCPGTPARVPPLCPLGQAATNAFFDNIDGPVNWGVEAATAVGPNAWFLADIFATSPPLHLLALDQGVVTHGRLTKAPLVLPAGARLQFNHAYGFDTDAGGFYDGGVLEYRNETGPGPWLDAAPLFAAGTPYDGPIEVGFGNLLEGRQAFAGHSFGYTASQYNLSSLAGQNTRLAFRLGTDSTVSDFGWYLDDVRLYSCGVPSDLIFANGFDTGGIAAWSPSSFTDSGDMATTGAAALAGSPIGLQGLIDDTTPLFVQDDTPNNEPRYRMRFYIDPNTFDPGEAVLHRRTRVFIAFEELPNVRVFALVLRRVNGQYSLMGRARLDSGVRADTGFFNITNAPHAVEIDWVKSSGPDANDGTFEMWIDGVSVSRLTGLDNSISTVDFARLGALSVKTGANGLMFWDHFDSRRLSYIGP